MINSYDYNHDFRLKNWFTLFLPFLLLLVFQTSILGQWTQTNLSGNINVLFNHNNNIIAGFNGNSRVGITYNHGSNWMDINNGLENTVDVRAFGANDDYIFLGAKGHGVFRALNDGNYNWVNIMSYGSSSLLVRGSEVFAGTNGGGIFYSSDNGTNWTQINNGLTMLYVYALIEHDSYIFAGTYHEGTLNGGGVFRSDDNGQNWIAINNGLSNLSVMSFTANSDYVFVGTNGGGTHRTSDNGNSWISVTGGASTHALKVVCSDIYAGNLNNGGLVRSSDNGNNWQSYTSGLSSSGGLTVTSFAYNDSYIFTGSLGGGVARSIYECKGSLKGHKFFDSNGNGVKDLNETGMPEWIIKLTYTDSLGTNIIFDTTDIDGKYSFSNLSTNYNYNLEELLKPGWHQTFPSSPGNYEISFGVESEIDSLDFGNNVDSLSECVVAPLGMVAWYPMDESIGDTAIVDIIGQNHAKPMPGNISSMAGVGPVPGITLQFLNPKYVVDGSLFYYADAVLNYAQVEHNSSLEFGSGEFTIDAWVYPVVGSQYILPIVDKVSINSCTGFRAFILNGEITFTILDGNLFTTIKAPIEYSKWQHIGLVRSNQNNLLIYIDGMLVNYTSTQVQNIDNNADMFIGKPNSIGNQGGQCELPSTYSIGEIAIDELEIFNRALSQSEIISIWKAGSFGKCKFGSISGLKFNDINGNGIMDDGEPGIPNWEIKLAGNISQTAMTDTDGNYSFNNLTAGNYLLSETNQPGWVQTHPEAPSFYEIDLAIGDNLQGFDFGNMYDSSMACIIWDLAENDLVSNIIGDINGQTEIMSSGSAFPFMTLFGYNNGQMLWVGNNGWVSGAIDTLRYIEFNTAPNPGFQFTINNLSFDYFDFQLGFNTNILNFQAAYSTDNWITSSFISTNSFAYLNTSINNFNESLNVTVTDQQTFSLRIFPYAVQNGIASTPTFAIHRNVRICGTVNTVTEVKSDKDKNLPQEFRLEQNYPNPFNPSTSIEYTVPSSEFVTVKVYDILGNEVATLVNEQKQAGTYRVNFDSNNLVSGIYIYKIQAGMYSQVRKMMLLK